MTTDPKRRITLTRLGLMLSIMIVLTFIPAYAMSVSLMFLMAAMFTGLLIYNFLAVFRCLRHLDIEPTHFGDLFAGSSGLVHLHLAVPTRHGTIHYLRLQCRGENLIITPEILPSIPAGRAFEVTLNVLPQKRGWACLKHCSLIVAHPFGLVQVRLDIALSNNVLVYPCLLSGKRPGLFAEHEQQGLLPKSSDDFVYLASYQPGEDVRLIHWRKSALLEQPVLKRDQGQVDIVLPRLFVPDACPHFEYALSLMASQFNKNTQLTGWQVLTETGLEKADSRDKMLHLLALLQPIEHSAGLDYERRGFQVLYASALPHG